MSIGRNVACISIVPILLVGACKRAEIPISPTRTIITSDGTITLVDDVDSNAAIPPDPCPANTRLIAGFYCPQVEQKCLKWLDKDQSPKANFGIGPLRCAEFAPPKCLSKQRKEMMYCIDTYEWPNRKGEFPPVGMSWYDADRECRSIGKRLCTAEEWTFACEGPDMNPYPYGDGLHRDETACNIDKPSMNPDTPRPEWIKHYRAVESGSMTRCVSWAGVYDMSGNVDEWVNNVGGRTDKDPYFSGLKGGYWGPVRTRCRPMTTAHGPTHSFYQNGFRCCADAKRGM